MNARRYPKLHIRSKNELARQISSKRLPIPEASLLIQDAHENFDHYWRDHIKLSEPSKNKWVRDASRTNLSKLHKLINDRVLGPHDRMLPAFVFGGISGRDHKSAVKHLLGKKRGRILLKLDIKRFYERIRAERVQQFFAQKCECSYKGAKILTGLCCVPVGPKDSPGPHKTIGRGFAPSSRLAVWCNLDTFIKLERLVQKELKGKDPQISIYVDDIGITASKTSKEEMIALYKKIEKILDLDDNQKLPLNEEKTKIIYHSGETYDIRGNYLGKRGFEILGIQMNRNSLTLGTKTRWKLVNLKKEIHEKVKSNISLKKRRRAVIRYKRYIER